MNFREKYGQWAIVLGATEGIGKANAFELARRGMDVIFSRKKKGSFRNIS